MYVTTQSSGKRLMALSCTYIDVYVLNEKLNDRDKIRSVSCVTDEVIACSFDDLGIDSKKQIYFA